GPGLPGGPGNGASTAGQLQPVAGAHFAELPVSSITVNPRQPREHFDEQALAELAESIGTVGLLQPVAARTAPSGGEHEYELIMGERRWRASKMAGLEAIPAIVRDTGDDDLLRDALMENLHRQQLNPLEEAAAYQQLLQDFGATHEQLAARIGRSRPHITNTLRQLNLPPDLQRRVAAGVLSAGHARALLSRDSAAAQEHLAQRIVQEGLAGRARAAARSPSRPASRNWPTSSPTATRPRSAWTWAATRARSSSSSPPWRTSTASSSPWPPTRTTRPAPEPSLHRERPGQPTRGAHSFPPPNSPTAPTTSARRPRSRPSDAHPLHPATTPTIPAARAASCPPRQSCLGQVEALAEHVDADQHVA